VLHSTVSDTYHFTLFLGLLGALVVFLSLSWLRSVVVRASDLWSTGREFDS